MTRGLFIIALVSLSACWAQADNCRAQSNGQRFQASSSSEVIRQCQFDYRTSNSECERSVRCQSDSYQQNQYGSQNGNSYGNQGGYGSNSHGGGGYGQQPSQPSHQPPSQPSQPSGPTHSLPAGSYTLSCRNASMSGTYLSADCRNMRGGWVYSQLNLSQCDGGDVGNNDGRLQCHPR